VTSTNRDAVVWARVLKATGPSVLPDWLLTGLASCTVCRSVEYERVAARGSWHSMQPDAWLDPSGLRDNAKHELLSKHGAFSWTLRPHSYELYIIRTMHLRTIMVITTVLAFPQVFQTPAPPHAR
jgi:hypothetical protein